ncbi:MAG TPA: nickel pincer cofactor biosynthesis protein LarC [Longimicrobiales bacterium]|nr:nickel pincer cofactor biosynthesis protein LarC [Longimicrobiales bacterium]
MRTLLFDPFAGISGDMTLGALLGLGYPAERMRDVATALGAPDGSVLIDAVQRQGIACTAVRFDLPAGNAHRHLGDIVAILERGLDDARAYDIARRTFERLADAEAAIHGVGRDEVHFHEVGGLDAILDIGCAADAVVHLGVEACSTRPVAIGSGWIDIEHGRFPLPAPATLRLLEGLDVRETRWEGECTTPTGAALLAELTGGRAAPPTFRVLGSAYGAGSRDPGDRPNCLRAVLCELSSEEDNSLWMVQSDLDDMSPEYVPPALDAMRAAGALDVVTIGVGMKKGRAGVRIEALTPRHGLQRVLEALFASTTTIGARYWPVERAELAREELRRGWHGSSIRMKQVRLPDGTRRAKPEYDDVVRVAGETGRTPLDVRRALDGTTDDDAGGSAPGPAHRT